MVKMIYILVLQNMNGQIYFRQQRCACLSDNDEDGYAPIQDGGLDCDDSNPFYSPLANEADPEVCYYDSDRDGYGDDLQSSIPSDAPSTLHYQELIVMTMNKCFTFSK